jgi:hypothetical protein
MDARHDPVIHRHNGFSITNHKIHAVMMRMPGSRQVVAVKIEDPLTAWCRIVSG